MSHKAIVLDANILIRAVLGKRARELILEYAATVNFFAPDVAYADARKYLPALLEKRGVESAVAMMVLDALESMVHPLELELYAGLQQQALQRIAMRCGCATGWRARWRARKTCWPACAPCSVTPMSGWWPLRALAAANRRRLQ